MVDLSKTYMGEMQNGTNSRQKLMGRDNSGNVCRDGRIMLMCIFEIYDMNQGYSPIAVLVNKRIICSIRIINFSIKTPYQ
jgi:hypothetical protein